MTVTQSQVQTDYRQRRHQDRVRRAVRRDAGSGARSSRAAEPAAAAAVAQPPAAAAPPPPHLRLRPAPSVELRTRQRARLLRSRSNRRSVRHRSSTPAPRHDRPPGQRAPAVARGAQYMGFPEKFNRYYTDPAWQPSKVVYVSPDGSGNGAHPTGPCRPRRRLTRPSPAPRCIFCAGHTKAASNSRRRTAAPTTTRSCFMANATRTDRSA